MMQRRDVPQRWLCRSRSCAGAGSVLQGGEGRGGSPAPCASCGGKGGRGDAIWGPGSLIPTPQGKAVEQQQVGQLPILGKGRKRLLRTLTVRIKVCQI